MDTSHPKKYKHSEQIERDEGTLTRRQKQIDYGKCTTGYTLYCEQLPR